MKLLFVVNTLTEFVSFCYIECKLFAYLYKDFVRQLKAFLPSFYHLCACEMSPGWGHLITWMDPSVGHLNGILAQVGGSLNNNFQKSQMSGLPWGGGMLKLQFDWYITVLICLVKKMMYNEAIPVASLQTSFGVRLSRIQWMHDKLTPKDVCREASYSGCLLNVSMWQNFKWNFVLVVVLYQEFKAVYYYNIILPKQESFLHKHAH